MVVADATVIPDSKKINAISACPTFNSSVECQPSTKKQTRIGSSFRLQKIARLLLSGSMLSPCLERSPENLVSHRSNTKLAQLGCILSWQSKIKPKVARNSAKQNKNISQSVAVTPPLTKFPKLSRSSLIVSPPQQDGYLAPSWQLANPAPATERIASPFGWRRRPYSNQLQFHQGIDYGAPLGSPVVSASNGIVTKVTSGCMDFGSFFCGGQLGNWIEIDHGHGAIAVYGHLKHNSITVKPGMKVGKNQQIAQVGSSGWSTGAHLDFRIKVNGEYADPAKLVMAIKANSDRL